MSNFSGAIKLGDLSDFIAPSQACVVKLDGSKVVLGTADLGEVSLPRCCFQLLLRVLRAERQSAGLQNVICQSTI